MASAAADLTEPHVLAHAKRRLFPDADEPDTYSVVDTQFSTEKWRPGRRIQQSVREALAPFNHVPLGEVLHVRRDDREPFGFRVLDYRLVGSFGSESVHVTTVVNLVAVPSEREDVLLGDVRVGEDSHGVSVRPFVRSDITARRAFEELPGSSFPLTTSGGGFSLTLFEFLAVVVVVRERVEEIGHGYLVLARDDVRVLLPIDDAPLDIEDRDPGSLDTGVAGTDSVVADDRGHERE